MRLQTETRNRKSGPVTGPFAIRLALFPLTPLALLLSLTVTAATAAPLLPDLFPWAHQNPYYMYGGTIDNNLIKNKVIYRFDNALPNIGVGALELREETHPDLTQDVYQRIYQSDGNVTETLIGTFADVVHPYGHLYLPGIAQYNLRTVVGENGVGPIVSSHDKTSYALVDSTAYDLTIPGAQSRKYTSVNAAYLGISIGWADVYATNSKGQWADATGLPDGNYWLEVIADPYNRIQESDEMNNVTRIMVNLTIPDPQIMPGDYNQDGTVSAADYTVWRNTIGATVALPGTGADGDGDGKITALDYPVWKLHYGDPQNAAGAFSNQVPEPTIITLVVTLMFATSQFIPRRGTRPAGPKRSCSSRRRC